MTACFIVRAEVVDPSAKTAFDRWYEDEHLPDALKAFGADRAWRGWSEFEPQVHYAFYEFEDVARARAIQGSDALKGLVGEFDRLWDGKVTRRRDLVESLQRIGC
jgi:hypothetical protein